MTSSLKVAVRLMLTLAFLAGVVRALVAQQRGNVAATLHNLSVSGPGDVRSQRESEVCKFCHIPHHPVQRESLWSQRLPVAQYETPKLRRSGTETAAPQPDGASRLCLSCHDGTVALGDIGGRSSARTADTRITRSMRRYFGTDLSGSHPVSFVVVDGDSSSGPARDMGLKPLATIQSDSDVRLDERGRMQCTTCHDPHDDRNYRPDRTPHFLVKPTTTEVCLACHELL